MKYSVIFLLLAKCCFLYGDGTFGGFYRYGQIPNLSLASTTHLDKPEGKIVGGQEAKPYSRPYIVSLQKRFFWVRLHICGGSLLNEYWIFNPCPSSYHDVALPKELSGNHVKRLNSFNILYTPSKEHLCQLLTSIGYFYCTTILTAGHCVKESWLLSWLPMDAVVGIYNVERFDAKAQILTAGHCVKESWLLSWLPMDAVVGSHNVERFDAKAQVATVTKRVPHPLYNGEIGPHDIGVVRVDRPFTFTKYVQPIRLPIHYKMHTQGMSLAGWGALKSNIFIPDMPEKLQEVNVTLMSYDECYTAVDELTEEGNPLDKDANICTGPISGGVAACSGDSGGPLVQFLPYNDYGENEYNEPSTEGTTINYSEGNLYNGDQHDEIVPVIFGVVSWGASPCGSKGAPTVYTKVTQYLDFIKYNTNNLSTGNNKY